LSEGNKGNDKLSRSIAIFSKKRSKIVKSAKRDTSNQSVQNKISLDPLAKNILDLRRNIYKKGIG